jgi:hypothetical protein
VKTRHESVPTRAACRGSSPRIHPKSRETAGLSGCTASHAEVGAVFAAEVFTPRPTPTMCHAPARLPRGHVHDVHRGTERERLGHEVAPTSLPPVPATQHTRCLPRVGPSGQPSGSRVQWNTPFLCLHRICSLFPIVIFCLASRDTTCRPSYSPSPAMVYFSFAKTHQSIWRRRERAEEVRACYVWSGSSSTGSERRAHRAPPAGGAMARLEAPTRTMMHTTDVMETMHVAPQRPLSMNSWCVQ